MLRVFLKLIFIEPWKVPSITGDRRSRRLRGRQIFWFLLHRLAKETRPESEAWAKAFDFDFHPAKRIKPGAFASHPRQRNTNNKL